jgi:GTPase SAR1 family protein
MTEEEIKYISGILIGDAITEKTSLRKKLGITESLDITFTGPFTLISRGLIIKNQKIQFSLWTMDSSSENWKIERGTYYKYATGAIIIFDSTDENWINWLKFWVKEIKREKSKINMVLVHNLIDKDEIESKHIEEIIAEKIFKRYKKKFSIIELRSITDKIIKKIYLKLIE